MGQVAALPEVIVRFAQSLDVTTDELLGLKESPTAGTKHSLKTLRRLKRIEPPRIAAEGTVQHD